MRDMIQHAGSASVDPSEVAWLLQEWPPSYDPSQLWTDYGQEAATMLDTFHRQQRDEFLPLLAVPGVATRWRVFLEWMQTGPELRDNLADVFVHFAQFLGRLPSHRALALTAGEYESIRAADAIVPSGRLRTDAATLKTYLRTEGVRKIIHTRMCNIGAFQYDPSLSLHDDPETAVCIAEGYMEPPDRFIYCMELSVPVIETVGWRMCDVDGWKGWFEHRGIWFDTTNPRTERFVFLQIPGLGRRCQSVRVFKGHREVQKYLRPFAKQQERLRKASSLPSAE